MLTMTLIAATLPCNGVMITGGFIAITVILLLMMVRIGSASKIGTQGFSLGQVISARRLPNGCAMQSKRCYTNVGDFNLSIGGTLAFVIQRPMVIDLVALLMDLIVERLGFRRWTWSQ